MESLETRELLARSSMLDETLRVAAKAHKPLKPIVIPIKIVQQPSADGTTIIDGKTTPRAKLKLDIGANGSTEQVVKADKKGHYQFTFHVDYGTTSVELIGPKSGRRPRIGELTIVRQIPSPTPTPTPSPSPTPTPPPLTLDLVGPPSGSLSRTEVTITGRTTDAKTGLSSVVVTVDGGPARPIAFDASGNFSYTTTLPLDGSADGLHTLAFTATDAAGNSTVTDASFTLDTRAPLVALTAPKSGLAVASNPTITGTVGDALGGVAGLQEQLDNGPPLPLAFDASTGAFSFKPALPLNETADGPHTVIFQAVDAAGNASTADFTFILDTTPPIEPSFNLAQTDRESSANGLATTNSQVTLVGQTDPDVSVSLEGTNLTAESTKTGTFQFAGVPLALGEDTYVVKAADEVGNTSQFQATMQRDPSAGGVDQVIYWNQVQLQAIENDASTPEFASRGLAMVSAAVYDAVNAINGTPGYYVSLKAPADASADAAVAAASYTVLSYLYPAQQSNLDAILATDLANIPDGQSKTDGMAVGQSVANAIIAMRVNDGSTGYVDYTPGTAAGDWQPTAPSFMPAENPQWATLKPFAMTSDSQFRPGPPPNMTSQEYADDINQTLSLGAVNSTTRTADETQIAKFWNDGAGTYTPPGHWNAIAEQVAQQQGDSLSQDARLFAELNVARATRRSSPGTRSTPTTPGGRSSSPTGPAPP